MTFSPPKLGKPLLAEAVLKAILKSKQNTSCFQQHSLRVMQSRGAFNLIVSNLGSCNKMCSLGSTESFYSIGLPFSLLMIMAEKLHQGVKSSHSYGGHSYLCLLIFDDVFKFFLKRSLSV